MLTDHLQCPPEPDLRQWAAIEAALPGRRRIRLLARWCLWLSGPAIAAGAAAVWLLLATGVRPPLSYVSQGCAIGPEPGTVTTEVGETGNITFSDGSTIALRGGSRGRLAVPARPSSAQLILESGTADLDVVHGHDTRWAVEAGPFRVEVKGTQFRVSWSPARRHFRLQMQRGEVLVSGRAVPGGRRTLRTGQVLVSIDGEIAVEDPAPPAAATPPGDLAPPANAASSDTRAARPHRPRVPRVGPQPEPQLQPPMENVRPRAGGEPVAAQPSRPGSPVFIGSDGKLGGPMTGYAWVAAGLGATIVTPAPCNDRGCFKQIEGELCTRGSIPALRCTGQGTPGYACNWGANWGSMIGVHTTSNRGPWLSDAPASLSLAYHGQRGTYRLNVHLAGDPDNKVYCIDAYRSGQAAEPSMFKTKCWGDSGQALGSFQQVDKIGLQLTSTESPTPFDYCVSALAVNGSAAAPVPLRPTPGSQAPRR